MAVTQPDEVFGRKSSLDKPLQELIAWCDKLVATLPSLPQFANPPPLFRQRLVMHCNSVAVCFSAHALKSARNADAYQQAQPKC
jgi:hypothetical protein